MLTYMLVLYVDSGRSHMLAVGGAICWKWAVQFINSGRSNMLTLVGGPIC